MSQTKQAPGPSVHLLHTPDTPQEMLRAFLLIAAALTASASKASEHADELLSEIKAQRPTLLAEATELLYPEGHSHEPGFLASMQTIDPLVRELLDIDNSIISKYRTATGEELARGNFTFTNRPEVSTRRRLQAETFGLAVDERTRCEGSLTVKITRDPSNSRFELTSLYSRAQATFVSDSPDVDERPIW